MSHVGDLLRVLQGCRLLLQNIKGDSLTCTYIKSYTTRWNPEFSVLRVPPPLLQASTHSSTVSAAQLTQPSTTPNAPLQPPLSAQASPPPIISATVSLPTVPQITTPPIETTVSVSTPSPTITKNAQQKSSTVPYLEPPQELLPEHREMHTARVPASQLGRLWHMGGLAAGIGIGTVSEYFKRTVFGTNTTMPMALNPANAERLAAALCRMRGAALKVGQMLSIQDEALVPPEFQKILERVRQNADMMPQRQLEKVLSDELGKTTPWRERFQLFDDKPVAAASIGQVHRAIILHGDMEREIAVKVQFPGIAESVDSDISNLSTLLGMVLPAGMFAPRLLESTRKELLLETDYLNEAKNQTLYRNLLKDTSHWEVPEIIPELSTKRILTSQFVRGVTIDTIASSCSQEERNWVGAQLMTLCLRETFEFKFMQTDPNWSNFLFNRENKKLYLLDFGACRKFSDLFLREYFNVIYAAAHKDRAGVLEASRKLGFLTGEETEVMNNAHIDAVMILGEPFAAESAHDFKKQNLTKRIHNLIPVMVKHRLVPPPEETYSLHRKLSGAFLACAKLGAVVDCRSIFMDIVKNFK